MLSIHGPAGPRPAERKAIRPRGSSGFHLPMSVGPDSVAGKAADPAGDIAPARVDAPGPTQALQGAALDRAAENHAGEMLDVLAEIQRDLLAPSRDPALFLRLATLADAAPDAASPALRQALRAVATRAKVELARDQMAEAAALMTGA